MDATQPHTSPTLYTRARATALRLRHAFNDTGVHISPRTGRLVVVPRDRRNSALAQIDRLNEIARRRQGEYGRLVERAQTAMATQKTGLRPYTAKGWEGTRRNSGLIDEEHNTALQWGAWRGDSSTIGVGKRLYREDPEYRSATNSLILPHIANPWHMKPADPNDADARMIAHAAEQMVVKDPGFQRLQWDRFLAIRDGVRVQEWDCRYDETFFAPAWARDESRAGRPWTKQDGGRTGLYVFKLHPRLPHTIEEWITRDDGSFGGIKQTMRDDDSGKADQPVIDADYLLRWTYGEEGTNWEGDPLGRPAYGLVNLRSDILRYLGIGASRWAVGTPLVEEIEANVLDDQDWDDLQLIAEQYGVHEQQFLMSQYGARFSILEAEMKTGDLLWNLYDGLGRGIHRLHGTMHTFSGEGYGSRSDIAAKIDHSILLIASLGQFVATPINGLLADWTEWNGWSRRLAPTLVHDDLQSKTPKEFAEMVKAGADAGIYTPQTDDEVQWREAAHLPELTEDATDDDQIDEPDEPDTIDGGSDAGEELPADAPAQDSALNGAQVTSAVDIVARVGAGTLPKTTARAMLIEFFNLSSAAADAILADVEEPEEEPGGDGDPVDEDEPTDDPPPTDDDDEADVVDLAATHDHDEVAATLALASMTGRAYRPHPGRSACLAHARMLGPLHALAEESFSGQQSRIGREERIQATTEAVAAVVARIADSYADRVAGKTIGEAAKEKIRPADLTELRRLLSRLYKAELRGAQETVKAELRAQKEDPEFPAKFAAAMEQMRTEGADPMAFATIAQKAGGATGSPLDDLDVEDFINGAVRTTADAIGQDVERATRAGVQSRAAQPGGASKLDLARAVQLALPLGKLVAKVQPDIQGVHSTGRAIQLAKDQVPWSVYTNTPELSSEVCEVCLDTAASTNNPYETGGPNAGEFPTPNPDCYGNLSGDGNRCWCVTIGLSQPPEDSAAIRDFAQGDMEQ